MNYKIYVNSKIQKAIIVRIEDMKIFKINYKAAIKLYNESEEQINQLLSNYDVRKENSQIKMGELKHLRLIMINGCNLNCKYCYANCGDYDKESKYLDEQSLIKIIDRVFLEYNIIDELSFFGGEPLLNKKGITTVCDYISKKGYNVRNFSMVTNGTLIDEQISEYIKKYDIKTVISIDGDKEIHDYQRPTKNNSPTYDTIVNGISLLTSKGVEIASIESTYTRIHENSNITVNQLKNTLIQTFNVRDVNVVPVVTDNPEFKLKNEIKNSKNSFEKAFYELETNKTINHKLIRYLSVIFSKVKDESCLYCNAGLSQFTIFTDGTVYPCQMFIGNDDFSLGNIYDEDFHFKKYNKNLLGTNKNNDADCKKCEVYHFCQSCIGENYEKNHTLSPKSEDFCRQLKNEINSFFEVFIRYIYDEEHLHKLINIIKEIGDLYA